MLSNEFKFEAVMILSKWITPICFSDMFFCHFYKEKQLLWHPLYMFHVIKLPKMLGILSKERICCQGNKFLSETVTN